MALNARGVSGDGLIAAAETLARPSHEFGNDERVEALWAVKAMEHAEVYFNILCSVDPSRILRLSSRDDDIHDTFKQEFPDLDVRILKESDLKSETVKSKWREFCEKFKQIEDYNFATLLRLDSEKDYSEENSIIVTKIQFYAIEISRNRLGYNDKIRLSYKPKPRQPKSSRLEASSSSASMAMTEVEYELQQILSGNHKLLQK